MVRPIFGLGGGSGFKLLGGDLSPSKEESGEAKDFLLVNMSISLMEDLTRGGLVELGGGGGGCLLLLPPPLELLVVLLLLNTLRVSSSSFKSISGSGEVDMTPVQVNISIK